MAKHTINNKYQAHDTALSVRRQFLSCQKHKNEIYYHMEPVEEEQKSSPHTVLDTPLLPIAARAGSSAAALEPAVSSRNITVALLPDSTPQVSDIVRTIVAEKLKISTDQIPLNGIIKILAAGMYHRLGFLAERKVLSLILINL